MVLNSDRGDVNNFRLMENWRPIWTQLFNEFKNTKFVLYHKHDNLKIKIIGDNVSVDTSRIKKSA